MNAVTAVVGLMTFDDDDLTDDNFKPTTAGAYCSYLCLIAELVEYTAPDRT